MNLGAAILIDPPGEGIFAGHGLLKLGHELM
jgi:hypothetical protein